MTVGIFLEDGVEARICAEIAARQKRGIAKYGMTVAENPLSLLRLLQHAKEECLDQAIYLERAIAEIDAQQARQAGKPECFGTCGNVGHAE
mgnify:CR=1 FL=1